MDPIDNINRLHPIIIESEEQEIPNLPVEIFIYILGFNCSSNDDIKNIELVNKFFNKKILQIPREEFSIILDFLHDLTKLTTYNVINGRVFRHREIFSDLIRNHQRSEIIIIGKIKYVNNLFDLKKKIIDRLSKLEVCELQYIEKKFENKKFPKFLDPVFDQAIIKKIDISKSPKNHQNNFKLLTDKYTIILKYKDVDDLIKEVCKGSDENKTLGLCVISNILISKEIDKAIKVIKMLPKIKFQYTEDLTSKVVYKIIITLIKDNRYKDALSLMNSQIFDEVLLVQTQAKVCIALSKMGQPYTAIDLLKNIRKDPFNTKIINDMGVKAEIISELLKMKDFETADELAKTVNSDSLKFSVLNMIANQLLDESILSSNKLLLDKAISILLEVPNQSIYCVEFKFEILTKIVLHLFSQGFIEDAITLAETKLVGKHKDDALKLISIEFSKTGKHEDLDRAEEVINKILNNYGKMNVLEIVFSKRIELNQIFLVIRKASLLPETLRSMALVFVVKKLCNIHLVKACEVAELIVKEDYTNKAYLEIFQAYVLNGELKEAKEIYEKLSCKFEASLYIVDNLMDFLEKDGLSNSIKLLEMLEGDHKRICILKILKNYLNKTDYRKSLNIIHAYLNKKERLESILESSRDYIDSQVFYNLLKLIDYVDDVRGPQEDYQNYSYCDDEDGLNFYDYYDEH
jgi:hypothetical protein